MSSRFLVRAAAALLLLLVLWAGFSLVRRAGRDETVAFAMPKADSATVDAIVIARKTDTVRLGRAAGGWTVNGASGNGDLVRELLGALTDTAARSELVAESPSSHARLGIDSAGARRVSFRKGDEELAALLVGGRGGSWETAYLRAPGSNQVYQVRGRWVEWVERQPDDWRDKRIVAIEPDSLAAVEVQVGKAGWALHRADRTWTIDGVPADSAAVASYLAVFRKLEAAGFATQAQTDSADFTRPDRTIRLSAPGDRVLATLAIDSTTGGLWLRRDGDGTVYRLDGWVANQLTPRDSTLRKRP